MRARPLTGKDIAQLLLLCAPTDALTNLELSEQTIDVFAKEFDEMDSYHQVPLTALALYYCNTSIVFYQKSQKITSMLYFTSDVIYSLVQLVKAESFEDTNELTKQIISARNSRNRTKGHNNPGGYNTKKEAVLVEWASGKYRTRTECAEKVYVKFGITYETARKYLRNAPKPKSTKSLRRND